MRALTLTCTTRPPPLPWPRWPPAARNEHEHDEETHEHVKEALRVTSESHVARVNYHFLQAAGLTHTEAATVLAKQPHLHSHPLDTPLDKQVRVRSGRRQ